jgi:hypothetical protein
VAGAARSAINREPDDPVVAWVAAHREVLQAGGIVVGILALLILDLSWFGLFLLVALVVAYELVVQRLADIGARGAPPEEGPPVPAGGGPAVEPQ